MVAGSYTVVLGLPWLPPGSATYGALGGSPSSLCLGELICKMGVMGRTRSCSVTVRMNSAGERSYHDWFGLKT